MLTRIDVRDTRLENAVDTITSTADIKSQEPLGVTFSFGGRMTAGYMNYEGLLEMMRGICKNWELVRKLKITVEIEESRGGSK